MKKITMVIMSIGICSFLLLCSYRVKTAEGSEITLDQAVNTYKTLKKIAQELVKDWDIISSLFKKSDVQKGVVQISSTAQIPTVLPNKTNTISRIEKRAINVRHTIMNQNNYTTTQIPSIAIACNGAGIQGMASCLGFLDALEENEVIKATSYIAASSAAIWALTGWYLHVLQYGATELKAYNNQLLKLYQQLGSPLNNEFSITQNAQKIHKFLEEYIWPKIVCKKPINTIDLTAGLLQELIHVPPINYFDTTPVSMLKPLVQNGTMPFLLFQALGCVEHKNSFIQTHYEISPQEIRNIETGYSFETYGLGKTFNQGIWQKEADQCMTAEINSYQLSAITGSYVISEGALKKTLLKDKTLAAFSQIGYKVNVSFLKKATSWLKKIHSLFKTKDASAAFKKIKEQTENIKPALYVAELEKSFQQTSFELEQSLTTKGGAVRNYTKIPNPLYGFSNIPASLSTSPTMCLTDQAYCYDAPLLSLFNKQREINSIIFCDANNDNTDFKRALADIEKKYGVAYTLTVKEKKCAIYQPTDILSTAPWIVYIAPESQLSIISKNVFDINRSEYTALFNASSTAVNENIGTIKSVIFRQDKTAFHEAVQGFGS